MLESHHVSAAYRLLQDDDEMNILYNLSKDDWRSVGLEVKGKSQLSVDFIEFKIDLLYKHEDLVFSPQHMAVYFSSCLVVLPGS